jgi:GNAT superfamily N-acetyltransferase
MDAVTNLMPAGRRAHKSATCRVDIPEGLPQDMRDGIREIVAVESSNPRKGHATALMHELCTDADAAGIVLLLRPHPFAPGMDSEQLVNWYTRFGFEPIQGEPVLMARPVRVHGRFRTT